MILPDVNLLVYAHNANSPFHPSAKRWWLRVLQTQSIALTDATLAGFVRIVTHGAIMTHPLKVDDAFKITDGWLGISTVRVVRPGARHYVIFRDLLKHIGTGGNLVTDAHLAALAIEHQCELHSNDTDFMRFPGLNWVNPLE